MDPMPRIKKKYMEKAQPEVAPLATVQSASPPVPVITMRLKDIAARHGVPSKTIATLAKKYGLDNARMGKFGTLRVADVDALWAKLQLCEKLNADPYLLTLPLSKRWKWRPRKPTDVIAYTPEQAHAETRAVEYALASGIPLTTRDDSAFVFLDLQGLICFPSSKERPKGYAFANVLDRKK
jgi:hypothetical protein